MRVCIHYSLANIIRTFYPEEVVTHRHRVRQGCLARIVELDQRSQFKAQKTQARKAE